MPRKVLAGGRPNTDPFPESAMDQAAIVNNTGMPYEATILRQSGAATGGTVKKAYVPDPAVVPCRLGPVGQAGRDSRAGGRVHEDSTHVVTFARAVTMRLTDRVLIAGTEYLVTAHPGFGDEESGRRWEVATA